MTTRKDTGDIIIGAVMALATFALVGAVASEIWYYASGQYAHHFTAFYSECLKDRKAYECDVLWRQETRGRLFRLSRVGAP